jgi:hypothetical protein
VRDPRLGADGAFHRTARSSETRDGVGGTTTDDVTVALDGVVGARTIRGRLRRTDAYSGQARGTCTRTIRFAVARD